LKIFFWIFILLFFKFFPGPTIKTFLLFNILTSNNLFEVFLNFWRRGKEKEGKHYYYEVE